MTSTAQENERMYKDLHFRMLCLEDEVAGWKKKFETESIWRQVVEQWIGEEFGFDVSDEIRNLERILPRMSKTWKRTISNINLTEAKDSKNTNKEKNDPAAVLSRNIDEEFNKINILSNGHITKNPVAFEIFKFNNNHTSSAHFRTANRAASTRKAKHSNLLPATKFSITKHDDFSMAKRAKHDFNSTPTSAKTSDAQRTRYSAAATAIPLHFSSQPAPAEPNVAAPNTFGNSSMEAALKPNPNSVKSEREEMDPLQIFGNSSDALQLTLVDPIWHTMTKTYVTPESYHIQQNSAFEDVGKLELINSEGAQIDSATMLKETPIKLELTTGMEKEQQSSKKLNFTNSEAIIMDTETEMMRAKVNTTMVRTRRKNNFSQCMECIKIGKVFPCPSLESLGNHLKIVHGARIRMGEHKSTKAKTRNELRSKQCLKESVATAKGKRSNKKNTTTQVIAPSLEPSVLLNKSSQLLDYSSPRVICKEILNKSPLHNGANGGTGKVIPRSADPDGKTVVAESETVAPEEDSLLEVSLSNVVNIKTAPNTRYSHTGNNTDPSHNLSDGFEEGPMDKSSNSRRRKQILVPILFPYDSVEEDFKI